MAGYTNSITPCKIRASTAFAGWLPFTIAANGRNRSQLCHNAALSIFWTFIFLLVGSCIGTNAVTAKTSKNLRTTRQLPFATQACTPTRSISYRVAAGLRTSQSRLNQSTNDACDAKSQETTQHGSNSSAQLYSSTWNITSHLCHKTRILLL